MDGGMEDEAEAMEEADEDALDQVDEEEYQPDEDTNNYTAIN